jgi:nucleotide-binding universal stress UspA family protein
MTEPGSNSSASAVSHNHAVQMTTAHPAGQQTTGMFEEVVVGVGDDGTGRDAVALGKELVSAHGRLTLVHVHVVASKPAPDSGAVGDAAKRRSACELLTALADEFSVDARVSCIEARSVRRGLHEFASNRRADLLVVGTTPPDESSPVPIRDHTREVLEDPPCAVAVAPPAHVAHVARVGRIGVAYDGSDESERALALGKRLAAERHAELSAFEAIKPPLYIHDPWNVEGEIEAQVEEARRRVEAASHVEARAGAGDAADELARYSDSVDLLVVGAHKYRPIDHLSNGSISQRLTGRASAALLVVPSLR